MNKGSIKIIKSYPYDSNIFTQGIEKIDNKIIISAGLYGESSIGILDLDTGKLTKKERLEESYFGEGLTFDNQNIWQLTWREETAILRDPKSLKVIKYVNYKGEGWGICFDGNDFIMSNGTSKLYFRDKSNFEIINEIIVRDRNKEVNQLNELEFYNDFIYANVWHSNYILKIDPKTGNVVKKYNAKILLKDKSISNNERLKFGVLNGIAHLQDNQFLLSGKNWSRIFKVELD